MTFRLSLKVSPKASRDAVTGWHDGALKVAVTAAPDKGKANKAVIKLLAKTLGLRPSALTIVQGQTSPSKVVEIEADAAVLDRLGLN